MNNKLWCSCKTLSCAIVFCDLTWTSYTLNKNYLSLSARLSWFAFTTLYTGTSDGIVIRASERNVFLITNNAKIFRPGPAEQGRQGRPPHYLAKFFCWRKRVKKKMKIAISKVLIWVYKEPFHNIPQINNIDNEDDKKIRDNFYWADRYVNCIFVSTAHAQ